VDIRNRLNEAASRNPQLREILHHGIEQIDFIEELIVDFEAIFSDTKQTGGIKETILDELRKDEASVLSALSDVLRWIPSRTVRSHYDDYIRNMWLNLNENDTTLNKYDELKFQTLEYLEHKGSRPDRNLGIDALYEAIKTLTEREKSQPFPKPTEGGMER